MSVHTGHHWEHDTDFIDRFWGPEWYGYHSVNGMAKHPLSDYYNNFLHQLARVEDNAGGTLPFGCEFGVPLGMRDPNAAAVQGNPTYTHAINSDESWITPIRFDIGSDWTYGQRTYGGGVLWGLPVIQGSRTHIYVPQHSYYGDGTTSQKKLIYQDWGRTPAETTAGLDQHCEWISHRRGYIMLGYGYRTDTAGLTPSTADQRWSGNAPAADSAINGWVNREPGAGRWVYGKHYALWDMHELILDNTDSSDNTLGAGSGYKTGNRRTQDVEAPQLGEEWRTPFGGWKESNPQQGPWRSRDGASGSDEDSARSWFGKATVGETPYFPHIPRYEEFVKGRIRHTMITVIYSNAGNGFGFTGTINKGPGWRRPAYASDGDFWDLDDGDSPIWFDSGGRGAGTVDIGDSGNPNAEQCAAPPCGMICRLSRAKYESADAALAASSHAGAPFARIYLRALHEYGMFIMDSNQSYESGTNVADWTNWQGADLDPAGHNHKNRHAFDPVVYRDWRFPLIDPADTTTILNPTGADPYTGYATPIDSGEWNNDAVCAIDHALTTIALIDYSDFEWVDISGLLENNYYSFRMA